MDFFTHLISSIGNSLFGGGNNNNVSSNDQKRKRDQQQPGFATAQSAPTPVSQPKPTSAPKLVQPKAIGPDLSGLSDSDAATAKDLISRGKNATGFINAARNSATANRAAQIANDPNVQMAQTAVDSAKNIVAGGQQGLGYLGDLAIRGGTLIGNVDNPFVSKEKNEASKAANIRFGEQLSNSLHGFKDISGNKIEGFSGSDDSARRVNSGTATIGDVGNIAGTALNTGLAATMFDPAVMLSPIRRILSGATREGEEAAVNTGVQAVDNPVIAPEAPVVEPIPPKPVEAGIKPVEVPKVSTVTPTVEVPKPQPVEAGVKAPELVQPRVAGNVKATTPAISPQPLAPEATRAEQSAQQAVDKAVDTVPQSDPQPVAVQQVETPAQTASKEAAQNVPSSLPTAPREIPVIEHDRSMAAGKPSVKGSSDARYNTEDENLDRIGKSSLIAEKGTAKTAGAHADELANKGFSKSDVRQMRNWIVKNADANGHYDSKSFKSFVEGLLNKADAPQGITDKQFADAGIPDFGDAPKTPGDAPATAEAQMSGTPVTSGRSAVNKVFPIDEEFDRRGTLIDINSTEDDLIDALYELRGTPVEGRSLSDTKRIRAIEQALKDGTPRPKAATSDNPLSPIEAEGRQLLADAPATGKLGTITRDAVHDGSINTPEGQQAMLAKTEAAAIAEAKEAGTTIEDIIRKGQQAWQKSRETGKDLTTKEAEDLIKGFTPEQQRVYKAYAQEISTLRDRSGLSLDGGYQGEWYGPRQALVDDKSAAFDPRMINEISRNKGGGVLGEELDVSTTPHQQAIQRYADSPAASARTVIETAETNPETGAARNINIPDKAKEELEDAMKDVVAKRDEASRLVRDGDKTGADKLEKEINDTIDDAFKKFIDSIPGGGSDRRAAISDIKALRGTYKQVTTQSLGLSNVFNRIADQGTKAVLGATRPITRQLEKAFSDHFARMGNADSMKLNTSKEARQAAKEFASGTLWNEIRSNFKANMKLAGAGKNPVLSAVDKIDSFINSTATAATQAGDVSTQVMRKTLELGLSRPEAQGLKTVDEYKQYLAKYIKTNEFKKDLDSVGSDILPRIGLAGGDDAVRGGGRISAGLSKYLDNGIRTIAEAKGIKDNRLIEELNGYVKGNLTGYAGVGSRVFSTVKDAAIGTKWRRAGEIAKSGDPEAVARATQMAAQGVADSIALYGSAGAAVMAATMAPGFIGYTGAQEKMGSSASAYNKDNNIPANQWYINLGGKRVYFDPSRPLGAPGVAANIGGSIATGKDLVSSIGNSVSQLYNQAGGSSLPDNIVNVASLFNPATPDSDRQYASERVQSMLAPSTGILNNVANWIDPVKRAPDNFVDYIKANLPGFRSDVPAAKTSAGDPVANSKQISGGSYLLSVADNPAAGSNNGEVSLDAEINRLQKLTGDVYPTKSNTNADSGKTQAFAKLLVNDPAYAALDDKAKAEQMKNVLNGTSTKDINDKLSDTDKMALLSHKLQGNKADVWLEDNTNNLNYLQAKYNNESANGTLKAIDKSMAHKGSLAQQLAIARVNAKNNVPQDVVGAYGDTSKSEFYDLPDGDEKNMLMAYDKALADAGLPSKYQNKYGQYASGSGGSGLASPSSLVIQPKQIGALSPDTTPVEYKMPSLQTYTPGGKVNPYIRSISTSKGVK